MTSTDDTCLSDQRFAESLAESDSLCKEQCIRKSTRDPSIAQMDRNDLSILHNRIKEDHFSTIVLKVKDHLLADINSSVFESIVEALWKNKVCQGLYIQNLSRAIGDEQLKKLIELLKKKKIWCLNIGESYEVSSAGWRLFCDKLPETNITHLYVSEHTIPIELKNKMRDHIRENRKKHKLHCAFKNVSVIERCTHMWWNPINGVKELKPPPPPKEKPESESEEEPEKMVPYLPPLTPAHTAYWQDGVGEGGDKPWKFKCMCGESCSSYENYRNHPTGRMYECSNPACCLWSHVACVLGPNVSDDEVAKMKELLCGACKAKSRRLSKYLGVSITQLNTPAVPESVPPKNKKKNAANKRGSGRPNGQGLAGVGGEEEEEEEDKTPWTFKCKCGEVCSSYENAMYHPAGQWFACSQCDVWSHVLCLLGNKTPDQVAAMEEVLCFSCTTKNRRNRNGRVQSTVQLPPPPPATAAVLAPAVAPDAVVTVMALATTAASTSPAQEATVAQADAISIDDVDKRSALVASTAPLESPLEPAETAVSVSVSVSVLPVVVPPAAEEVDKSLTSRETNNASVVSIDVDADSSIAQKRGQEQVEVTLELVVPPRPKFTQELKVEELNDISVQVEVEVSTEQVSELVKRKLPADADESSKI